MRGVWSNASSVAFLFVLASAQATAAEITPSSKTLEPMAYQPLTEGEVWQLRDKDGNSAEMRMQEVSGGMVTIARSDGCTWTRVEDGFPPSATWSNCGGSSGTHRVTRKGNIYPLSVGAEETWTYRGKDNSGNTWTGSRACEVTEIVAITVPAGSFDAYHVECKDPNWVRDFYVAPEIQRIVHFSREHKGNRRKQSFDLVALIKP